MRNVCFLIAGLAMVGALLFATTRTADAGPVQQLGELTRGGYDSRGNQGVDVKPMAPAHPAKITLAGTAEAHVLVTDGGTAPVCFRLACTVACSYEVVQQYPDAGFTLVDGGNPLATADSNPLGPIATAPPERVCVPPYFNTISVFSTGAGSAYPAGIYQ